MKFTICPVSKPYTNGIPNFKETSEQKGDISTSVAAKVWQQPCSRIVPVTRDASTWVMAHLQRPTSPQSRLQTEERPPRHLAASVPVLMALSQDMPHLQCQGIQLHNIVPSPQGLPAACALNNLIPFLLVLSSPCRRMHCVRCLMAAPCRAISPKLLQSLAHLTRHQ